MPSDFLSSSATPRALISPYPPHTQPHQLAGLAYDGIAAVGALLMTGQSDKFNRSSLTQSAGFEGIDGIFRLTSEGTNERGLGIPKVFNKRVVILDPAPSAFDFLSF